MSFISHLVKKVETSKVLRGLLIAVVSINLLGLPVLLLNVQYALADSEPVHQIISPANGAVINSPVTLDALYTDEDGDFYEEGVAWSIKKAPFNDDDPICRVSGQVVFNSNPEHSTYYPGFTYEANGVFSATVALEPGSYCFNIKKASDTDNSTRQYVFFEVVEKLPAPTLISPANNSVVNGASLTNEWSPVVDADKYRYTSWNDAGATSLRWKEDFTATSKTATNVADSVFWWKVAAIDAYGNVGEWSDLWKVTVVNPVISTVTVSGNTSAGENQPGWLFNRDTDTQSPFEFNTDEASIGSGSLFVEPIANDINGDSDKFIGELFLLDEVADVKAISYDYMIADGGSESDEDQFYMNVYTNFGDSSATKFYDCRYDIVPNNGTVGSFETVSFNLTTGAVSGGSVVNVQKHSSSLYNCPAAPAGMDAYAVGSRVRAVAISVGDTSNSDLGVSGYLDKVVIDTVTSLTTYDFEPAVSEPTPTPTPDNGNNSQIGASGGPAFVATPTPSPLVLGEEEINLEEMGLVADDLIQSEGDPDIYQVNANGFKRLFINPAVFLLNGFAWENIKSVSEEVRDALANSNLYRVEGSSDVYALEVTGEDEGILHKLVVSEEDLASLETKVFTVNQEEFDSYQLGDDYTSVDQVPAYARVFGSDPDEDADLAAQN